MWNGNNCIPTYNYNYIFYPSMGNSQASALGNSQASAPPWNQYPQIQAPHQVAVPVPQHPIAAPHPPPTPSLQHPIAAPHLPPAPSLPSMIPVQGTFNHSMQNFPPKMSEPLLQASKRQKLSSQEEISHQSKERNRMNARKTRQRKKNHMKMLRNKISELKDEKVKLQRTLDDRRTASALVAMSASPEGRITQLFDAIATQSEEDTDTISLTTSATSFEGSTPRKTVDKDGILDCSEKSRTSPVKVEEQNDVKFSQNEKDCQISPDLLRKDKDKCTPLELEVIRREKNRMHAKKTRARKKMYLEEMEITISSLEEENRKLREIIQKIGTFSLVLPVPVQPPDEKNSNIAAAQLLMDLMNDSKDKNISFNYSLNPTKNSDSLSDKTNSDSEGISTLEPGSSSSNGNGSCRSGDSNCADEDGNMSNASNEDSVS